MQFAKRIVLFFAVNILIVATLSIILSALGVSPQIGGNEIHWSNLAIFCLVWGFGASFISLGLSRIMAKWMMAVRVLKPNESLNPFEAELVTRVHQLARQAGLPSMPEVGIYESPEINAFATGPTRSRSLVAVSTGLLHQMREDEVEGVLAHEIAHIANGDMVTMTLVQGVLNALIMFAARVVGFIAGQFVDEQKRPWVQFGVVFALEISLGFLAMFVVAAFSRAREFRADSGGAKLAGTQKMIAALAALQRVQSRGAPEQIDEGRAPSLAAFKISSKQAGFMRFLSTHPALEDRILRLQSHHH